MVAQAIKNAIIGRERLWRVWWVYGFAISLIANIVKAIAFDSGQAGRVLVFAIAGVLSAIWAVMVWRCADNSDFQIGSFIRLSVAAGVIGMLVVLFVARNAHVVIQ